MLGDNLILLTDSYKVSHAKQYPPGTTEVYSYFESRGGLFSDVVFYGLQYFLKRYLTQPITQAMIDEAGEYFQLHFGPQGEHEHFNRAGWQYILEKHKGYLPLSIKAVPEGTPVPVKNVMMTVVNTDPECFWLTNYMETLLVQVWYPCTVATLSREQKKHLKAYLEKTAGSDSLAGLPFKLHDFGFRGSTSVESSALGGSAHLVNFVGTDTVSALVLAKEYYGSKMAGYSIPASEHSTITSWGRDKELEAMRNMLTAYPNGPVACVSDSYDIYSACSDKWGSELHDLIMNRDGFLVVRPDSGDPLVVLPKILGLLYEKFPGGENAQGYKMLDSHIRVIQGDGIDLDSLPKILETVAQAGFSTDNLAFGSGGGLLQKVNRDTCKFAFKCSSIVVAGERQEVYKQPIDCPWKISKKGQLKLIKDENTGEYRTINLEETGVDQMVEVYRDGKMLIHYGFDAVRENAKL